MLDKYPILPPPVEVNETDGGAVLRHRDGETYLFLSETQYSIISLCNGKRTVQEIIKIIQRKYNVGEELVKKDMERFFTVLREKNMLALSPIPWFRDHTKGKMYSRKVKKHPTKYSRLHVIGLILTERCPLECSYCFMALKAKNKSDEDVTMSPETAERLLKESYELGARTVILSGGELTAYPWTHRVISSAYKMGFKHIRLSTKGVGVTKDWAEKLFLSGIRGVQVSIDTLDNTTYKKMVTNGSVESALEGIYNLLDSRIEVFVRTTITRDNIEEIPEMWEFLRDLGVSATRGVVVTPEGRADFDLLPTSEEIKSLEERVKARLSSIKTTGEVRKSTRHFVWDIIYFRNGQPDSCGAGIFSLTVYPNGWVTLCDSARQRIYKYPELFVFGNFKVQSLKEIWTKSPVLQRFRESKFREECLDCPLLYDCMGGCPILKDVVFGTTDTVSPLCTRVFPYYADGRKRIEGEYWRWEKVAKNGSG